jgi:hypothetical protein
MKMDRSMRRGLFSTVAAIAATTFALIPTTSANASTSAVEFIECSEGRISVKVNTSTKAVTGSGSVTDCVAQVSGAYTSATISITGNATTIAGAVVSTVTNETIRWNTGETTTVRVERSYYGGSNVSGIGIGKTTGGALHPADEFDSGDGTRTVSAGQITLTKETQLIVSTS